MYRPEQRRPSLVTPGKMDVWPRFTPLPQFPLIGVSLCAVFEGASADSVQAGVAWDKLMRHHEPATADRPVRHKLYLSGSTKGSLRDSEAWIHFNDLSLKDEIFPRMGECHHWEWQLMRRPNQGAKAFCARLNEIEMFERGEIASWMWGFGHPHPFKEDFRVSQHFAGPVWDFPVQGGVFTAEEDDFWVFKPIYLKAGRPPGSSVTLLLDSYWAEGPALFVEVVPAESTHPRIREKEFVEKRRSGFLSPEEISAEETYNNEVYGQGSSHSPRRRF